MFAYPKAGKAAVGAQGIPQPGEHVQFKGLGCQGHPLHKSSGQGHSLSPTLELRPRVPALAKNPVRHMDTQVNAFPSKDFYVLDAS